MVVVVVSSVSIQFGVLSFAPFIVIEKRIH